MSDKSQVALLNFFIFNSTYGDKEGEEHKKVLFYHPPSDSEDFQIRSVGLSEALIKFTETFNPSKACESMHTQKSRQLFYQPENDFWLVMTLSLPQGTKGKDTNPVVEYYEEDVQDNVYVAALKQSYKMFRLFMGTFNTILEKSGLPCLIQRLGHFFNRYIPTMRLNNCDILDSFNGIQFFPGIDKCAYLNVQSLINVLEETYPEILYTIFLYNDQLVWSGLEQGDMQTMYRYLSSSLLPAFHEEQLQGTSPNNQLHYGRFVTGPRSLQEATNFGKLPRVYVNTDVKNEECHVLVYTANSATVCLLIDATRQLDFPFYKKLDAFMGPRLTTLAGLIAERGGNKAVVTDPQFKFIYFNQMNLAQKSTIHSDPYRKATVTVGPDVLRMFSDISADLAKYCDCGETIIKTNYDSWVVGKRSDQREFYVFITQKSANLTEVHEEVKRLCQLHFGGIFFLD